jgi:hypothetical protein
MSRWWRAYDEAVDDPKLQCLSDESFRFWFNLCCVCSAFGGNLPSEEHIAFKLRMQRRKVTRLMGVLVASGLIDKDDQGLRPHNWRVRQFKSDVSTDRVKRFRERPRNVSPAVSETPPETEYRIQKEKDAAVAAPDPEKDLFDRGKLVLGKTAGGLIRQLLAAKDGKVPLARAAIEVAATKQDPREYIGAILRNRDPPADRNYVDGRL